MKYFLGLEVSKSYAGIFLNQRKYACDILFDTGMTAVKPSLVPIKRNHQLIDNESEPLNQKDIVAYRRLVGRLLYLTITRPNLSYRVHILSQFISKPRADHLQAAYKMLKYIKAAPGRCLFFPRDSSLQLQAYKCHKQNTVSRSSVNLNTGLCHTHVVKLCG